MGKKFKKNIDRPWLALTVAICIGVVLFAFLEHLNVVGSAISYFFGVISPVVIGFIIAFILTPFAKGFNRTVFSKLKNRTASWLLSVSLTVIVIFGLVVLLMVFLVPQLVTSMSTFLHNLGLYVETLQGLLEGMSDSLPGSAYDLSWLYSWTDNIVSWAMNYVSEHHGEIIGTIGVIGVRIFYWIISFIVAVYVMADKNRIYDFFKRLVKVLTPDKSHKHIKIFWDRCSQIVQRFIIFDIVDAIIVGVVNAILMTCFGMSYIVLLSVVVAVANLFPTFGPIVGAIVGSFILVLVNPIHALIFLIFTIILQIIDGYILKPKLFGNVLSVSGLWILIMLIVCGGFFGVVGVFAAIPLGAALEFLYKNYIYPFLLDCKRRSRELKEAQEPDSKK